MGLADSALPTPPTTPGNEARFQLGSGDLGGGPELCTGAGTDVIVLEPDIPTAVGIDMSCTTVTVVAV
ncbi:hypothetical protein MNBD_ACTINO02-1016, partial [hydrothermal vent metagenome]